MMALTLSMNNLAAKIRYLLAVKKMQIGELADAVGISRQTMSKYLNSDELEKLLSAEMLGQIASILGVTYTELKSGEVLNGAQTKEDDLARLVKLLPAEKRNLMEELIRTLLQ